MSALSPVCLLELGFFEKSFFEKTRGITSHFALEVSHEATINR